jgi:aryl-alcohol dehydrogenase-like predicted oxidoreductase
MAMQMRQFGRTGWQVSEIGIGTWGMGGMWGPVNDQEALRAMRRAIELGVNFFDTAHVYGEGHVERLIARLGPRTLKQLKLATKVPPKNFEWPARHDAPVEEAFPSNWITRCTEQSLRRLGVDRLDLQQLHVWSPAWLSEREKWLPGVMKLKVQGKIAAFGISVNDHEPDTAMELVSSGLIDSVQVIFNLFEQAPAEKLLPACSQRNVAVIARVPFDEGSLTGALSAQTVFHDDDWRKLYFAGSKLRETADRIEALKADLGQQLLRDAALRFCLSHPAVSTVIPGMRRVAHVEANCGVSGTGLMSQEELDRLRKHAWERTASPVTG